ncbi:hypothetical protein C2845_PM13G00990 [Panicum miliaceum]|uniref:Uncharacterized protein n=1 Tax=Panicum miliaceum TaxID=4540 RepID=A0A3L6RLX9_PANMI|nr:hypothetical protein C2845_PM13G00990 [Panicum miliaceum]
MGRKRKELLSSAPWRTGEAAEDEEAARLSREGKVSVTNNPGETATMNVPRSRRQDLDLAVDDFDEEEIDPELRYSFQRNSRLNQALILFITVTSNHLDTCTIPPSEPEIRHIVSSWSYLKLFLKRVFSVDTLVKPLPPVMAYSVSRNVNFFFRIFTQFWDEEGIANAQKSLGLGNDDGSRRMR